MAKESHEQVSRASWLESSSTRNGQARFVIIGSVQKNPWERWGRLGRCSSWRWWFMIVLKEFKIWKIKQEIRFHSLHDCEGQCCGTGNILQTVSWLWSHNLWPVGLKTWRWEISWTFSLSHSDSKLWVFTVFPVFCLKNNSNSHFLSSPCHFHLPENLDRQPVAPRWCGSHVQIPKDATPVVNYIYNITMERSTIFNG